MPGSSLLIAAQPILECLAEPVADADQVLKSGPSLDWRKGDFEAWRVTRRTFMPRYRKNHAR
jgi:hypothetical protein